MADPIIVAAADIDRAVYMAVAAAKDDAEADILAGVTWHIAVEHPELSAAQLAAAIGQLHDAIAARRPDPRTDLSPNAAVLMRRMLTRAVPTLTSPVVREGARAYTRAFLDSHRAGTGQLRQVAPIELQFDRFGEVDRFRRHAWQRLYDLARDTPAVGEAVDQSRIAETLAVKTTQDATTVLGLVPLPPLNAFVADRIQPDGGIVVMPGDVDSVLADLGGTLTGLGASYAANLEEVVTLEERIRDLMDPPGGRADTSELESAIERAEKKQKDLDGMLNDTTKGVKGVFEVLALAAARSGDDGLAADIRQYAVVTTTMLTAVRDLASTAISTAKVVDGVISASASTLLLGGALAFNFAMLAVALQLSGLLGNRTKPINEVILEELRAVRKQITDLQSTMRVRFDRIEKRLNKIYAGLLSRLDEIDFDVGQIEGNIDELQLALYDLHAQLQRLNRDVHAFLEAGHRRALVEAINGSLNFQELTGAPLSFDEFREAENVFFSWARDHAKDELQAGPEVRGFDDDVVLAELTTLPLATNVNYLRLFPAERFGLPALSATRLANPFDWIVASEAYAQLSEESPSHADQLSPTRVQGIIAVGQTLGASLAEIARSDVTATAGCRAEQAATARLQNRLFELRQELELAPPGAVRAILQAIQAARASLFVAQRELQACMLRRAARAGPTFLALAEHHRTAFRGLADAISAFEAEFRVDPDTQLHGIDLWGGANQEPASHFFRQGFTELRRCDGRPFDQDHDAVPVPAGIPLFDSQLVPYLIASNLSRCAIPGVRDGLQPLSACVVARWNAISTEILGIGGLARVTYRLFISVDIRYGGATVFTHGFTTSELLGQIVDVDELNTFDPAERNDPHARLTGEQNLWSKLGTFPATHSLVNPALRVATAALVEQKLKLLQRAFYARVAQRFARAGDPIRRAGARLTGSKLLWQSFIAAGLPLSIEANEILRSLVFGGGAILGGADVDGDDALRDDVQDIYALFSSRPENPLPTNILGQIEALNADRVGRLVALLGDIVEAIQISGQPEPPELFAPTLLRLGLIRT